MAKKKKAALPRVKPSLSLETHFAMYVWEALPIKILAPFWYVHFEEQKGALPKVKENPYAIRLLKQMIEAEVVAVGEALPRVTQTPLLNRSWR